MPNRLRHVIKQKTIQEGIDIEKIHIIYICVFYVKSL